MYLTKLPLREDEGDVLALVSTLSLFAKGSKSVRAVILQKEKATHNFCPYDFEADVRLGHLKIKIY